MKLFILCQVILLLTFGPVYEVNAQHRAVYLNLKGVQPDTIRKHLMFRYRLSNIAPKDSLSVDLISSNREPFRLKAVYGDVGTVLTDGRNKKIYWDPVADHQRIDNSPVEIRFVVKTIPGQGLTRWQALRLGRWAVGAGLSVYTIWEGVGILKAVRNFNQQEQPNSLAEKSELEGKRADIQNRQKDFYRTAAISATAVLINLAWSAIQARHKLKPAKLAVIGANRSIGVAYKL